jgi:hypothetical protein
MKINVIVDTDHNANITARRLKSMGFTVTNINQVNGVIACEKADVNLKELRRTRGVQSVETNA